MFNLQSPYQPAGDQPKAIQQLVEGVNAQEKHQTLLGVTGSGKTFTIANVIQQTNRPTLVLNSSSFFLTTRLNISFRITTIINLKPICLQVVYILKRILQSIVN